jgi:hypothetical protein
MKAIVAVYDDDDDVYLSRITQQKPKNNLSYVKYRPARKRHKYKKGTNNTIDAHIVYSVISTIY